MSAILSSYGNDDPFWIGSHVYLATPGYYGESRAAQQIQGWPYAPLRDTEYANLEFTLCETLLALSSKV